MAKDYVVFRDGGYFVSDTRISLDSVVYAFLRGESPEGILDCFPALSLELVFGTLAYYAANRETIDAYLKAERSEFEEQRASWRKSNPDLAQRLLDAKFRTQVS